MALPAKGLEVDLTHIITSADGVLASSSISQYTKNVNDTARYDGELDFVYER